MAEKTKVKVGILNNAFSCDAIIYVKKLNEMVKDAKKLKLKDMYFEHGEVFITLYGYKKNDK